jgi:molybdopterin-guanine dinucleotide biosynthesis protein A
VKKVGILAGGSGSRMGGVEKGLLKINNTPVIKILVNELKEYEVVTVCRDEEQGRLYSSYSDVTFDHFKGMGPLAGIHAALRYFKDSVLIVGVDMPFVKRDVANMLLEEFSKHRNADSLIPVWRDGKKEPLLACYSYRAINGIERCLEKGERRIIKALDANRTVFYPVENLKQVDSELISFINLNTLEDLKKVRKICSSIDLEEELQT